jgi:hypothetical protein
MDGDRFDHLTRQLAASLSRRRLLRSAAGLAGGLLAGRAARAEAITCPAGRTECDGRCCDPGWECVGEAADRICSAPCEDGASRCPANSAGCCAGVCCPQNRVQFCCPADSICCPGAGSSECCPASSDWHCVTFEGTSICLFCPSTHTRCGAANCCAPGYVCQEGPNPGDGTCIPCPAGATKCGTKNCCTADETCSEDGECVDACPAGVAAQRDGGRRSRQREVTAQACEPPPPCPTGQVKCQGACVAACRGRRSLDGTTCKCTKKRCPDDKTKCDGECVNTTIDPSHCGGCAGNGGVTCLDGKCCGGECQGPGVACCGFNVCGVDETCCGQDATQCGPNERCCGDRCCPKDTYCANSRRELCCRAGEAYCRVGCCAIGTVCASFEDGICCSPYDPVYCPRKHRCAKSREEC